MVMRFASRDYGHVSCSNKKMRRKVFGKKLIIYWLVVVGYF